LTLGEWAARRGRFLGCRRRGAYDRSFMIAVIGNVLAGLLAVSLFTATLRISK
jgi:hypothetical protein